MKNLGRRLLLRRDSGHDAEDERPCKISKIQRSAETYSRENPRQSQLEIAKNISREFDQKPTIAHPSSQTLQKTLLTSPPPKPAAQP